MRHLSLLSALLVIASVFVACDKTVSNVETTPDSALLSELSGINSSLMSGRAETKASLKQIASIAIADVSGAASGAEGGAKVGAAVGTVFGNPLTGAAFGAFVGGVACSAVCSWAASPDTKAGGKPAVGYRAMTDLLEIALGMDDSALGKVSPGVMEKVVVDPELVLKTRLSESAKEAGRMHNILLAGMEGKLALDKGHRHGTRGEDAGESLESGILMSKEMEGVFNEVTRKGRRGGKHGSSLSSSVMSLFMDVMMKYPSDCKDMVFLINKYSEAIERSPEFSDTEKACVGNALATALYSFNYWSH